MFILNGAGHSNRSANVNIICTRKEKVMKYIEFVANKTELMQHAFTSAMYIELLPKYIK